MIRRNKIKAVLYCSIVGICIFLYIHFATVEKYVLSLTEGHAVRSIPSILGREPTDSFKGFLHTKTENQTGRQAKREPGSWKNQKPIHLAIVICGKKRLEEALTMLKSAVLFTKSFLIIHAFVDSDNNRKEVTAKLEGLPSKYRERIDYKFYNTSFPDEVKCKDCKGIKWETMLSPCATQRLFIPDILLDIDSLLYVDIDVLFLVPLDDIWAYLAKFNQTQFIACGPAPGPAKEQKGSKRKFKKETPEINSGLLLLNLTRLRKSNWLESMITSMDRRTFKWWLYDQEMINFYIGENPESEYSLSCEWNYRRRQCGYCKSADQNGIAVLHGSTGSFMKKKLTPPFKAVFSAFSQFNMGTHSIERDLLPAIRRNLDRVKTNETLMKSSFGSKCIPNDWIYTRRIESFVNSTQSP